MRPTLALGSALACFLLVALAAADDPPRAKAADPQEKFEPKGKAGAGQAYLARFAGDWDVAKSFHPRSGEPTRSKGRCTQSMIQGGLFLRSDFTFEGANAGPETTGTGLIGFEPDSGTFSSVWIDSRQTRMSLRRSRAPFDGSEIVLYGGSTDPSPKDARSSKTVSRLSPDGRTLLHRQFNLGPGGEERLIMELSMTRRD